MSENTKAPFIAIVILIAALLVGAFAFGVSLGRNGMKEKQNEIRFELREYTGVGSGVFKHGTIVEVVDGQPKVVGNFIDESGEYSPGTVEIVKVKQ